MLLWCLFDVSIVTQAEPYGFYTFIAVGQTDSSCNVHQLTMQETFCVLVHTFSGITQMVECSTRSFSRTNVKVDFS